MTQPKEPIQTDTTLTEQEKAILWGMLAATAYELVVVGLAVYLYFEYGLIETMISTMVALGIQLLAMKALKKDIHPVLYVQFFILMVFGLPAMLVDEDFYKYSQVGSGLIMGLAFFARSFYASYYDQTVPPLVQSFIPNDATGALSKYFHLKDEASQHTRIKQWTLIGLSIGIIIGLSLLYTQQDVLHSDFLEEWASWLCIAAPVIATPLLGWGSAHLVQAFPRIHDTIASSIPQNPHLWRKVDHLWSAEMTASALISGAVALWGNTDQWFIGSYTIGPSLTFIAFAIWGKWMYDAAKSSSSAQATEPSALCKQAT